MAESRKDAGPESTFIDFTRPLMSTTASSVTVAVLSCAKYSNAVGDAIARTDLISFGETMLADPCEGSVADAEAVLMDGCGALRSAVETASADFFWTAAGITAASAGAASSALTRVEGAGLSPAAASCAASVLGTDGAAVFDSAGGVELTGFGAFAVFGSAVLEVEAGCATGTEGAPAETGLGCASPGIQWRYHAVPKAASKAAAESRGMSRGLARILPPVASFDFAEDLADELARLIRITGVGA